MVSDVSNCKISLISSKHLDELRKNLDVYAVPMSCKGSDIFIVFKTDSGYILQKDIGSTQEEIAFLDLCIVLNHRNS